MSLNRRSPNRQDHPREAASTRRRRPRRKMTPPPSFLLYSVVEALLAVVLVASSFVVDGLADAAEFNDEIAHRVRERLRDFLSAPLSAVRLEVEYRSNGIFPHDLRGPDREAYLRMNEVFRRVLPRVDSLYYGLESGLFLSTGFTSRVATYREPSDGGYDASGNETDPSLLESYRKHHRTCVDKSGRTIGCDMSPGGPYVKCLDDCELVRCPDEDSQRGDCNEAGKDGGEGEEEREDCRGEVKWCRKYEKRFYDPAEGGDAQQLGYVPRLSFCIDSSGIPSQTPGQVVQSTYARSTSGESPPSDPDELWNCYHADGETMVNRSDETGPYEFCGDDGEVCRGTFLGAYTQHDYDPRWRGWYEATRQTQRRNWSPPYIFFAYELVMGITYSEPIHSTVDGKKVFMGVVAVDYTLGEISEFLLDSYIDSTSTIAVFEQDEPNYMIGTSTGTETGIKVLKDNESVPCPDFDSDRCTVLRVGVGDMSDVPDAKPMDHLVARAFMTQRDAGFPPDELVSVKADDDSIDSAVYVSQTQVFELDDSDLRWRVIITSPAEVGGDDAIVAGDALFGPIIAIGVLGMAVCLVLFWAFFRRRHLRAIVTSDWRFTSAFLLGCALMNAASTLSFLGPNTDGLCMLRMWTFHAPFALTFSPLFVKTYRMMKLVGGGRRGRRVKITHMKALLMCVPIVAAQIVILTIFSVIDPSRQTEIIENTEPDVTQRIICSHDTNAFFITELIYEGGLLVVGCVLAFKTRNLKGDYGESKQLIFTMYDIALVGSIVVIVTNVMGNYQSGRRLLYSVGIFWGTVFSSCAFVLPRLMRAGDENRHKSQNVIVSGVTNSAQISLRSSGGAALNASASMEVTSNRNASRLNSDLSSIHENRASKSSYQENNTSMSSQQEWENRPWRLNSDEFSENST